MKWIPGGRSFRASRRPRMSAEASELAQLLTAVAGGTDSGNNGSRLLLDQLIAITSHPGPAGHPGLTELRMLRASPRHLQTAQAAADILLDRARADPAFGAALDAWRGKDQVRRYLEASAARTGSEQASEKEKKSISRRFWKWTAGTIGAVATGALIATLTHAFSSGIPDGITNLVNGSGQPVIVKSVTEISPQGVLDALPGPENLSTSQLASALSPGYGLQQWLTEHGAVAVGNLYVELIVQGKRSSEVRILNIQPVVHCHSPLTGTLFNFPGQGGDTNTQLLYNIADPLAPPGYTVNTGGDIVTEPDYFEHYTVSLKKGEQFVFLIHASLSLAEYCQFTLNMSVDDGSRIVSENINNNGSPFAITGRCTAPSQRPYSCYQDLYFGGAAIGQIDPQSGYQPGGPQWIKVNPATFSYSPVPSASQASGSPRPSPVSSGSQPTSGQPSEKTAAQALAQLLASSASDRNAIVAAFSAVNSCRTGLPQDAKTFQQAAAARQQFISELSSIPGVSTLPAQMTQDLSGAWQASEQADQDFAAWASAEDSGSGCRPDDLANVSYQAARQPDDEATSDKHAFVRFWNPIATRYGLTTYQWNQM